MKFHDGKLIIMRLTRSAFFQSPKWMVNLSEHHLVATGSKKLLMILLIQVRSLLDDHFYDYQLSCMSFVLQFIELIR